MTLESRIRQALRAKSWDITALARAVGVSQPAVSTVINGKRPGNKLLPRMAEALGVPLEWLTVGQNPPAWVTQATEPVGPMTDERERHYRAMISELEEENAALRKRLAGVIAAAGGEQTAERGGQPRPAAGVKPRRAFQPVQPTTPHRT